MPGRKKLKSNARNWKAIDSPKVNATLVEANVLGRVVRLSEKVSRATLRGGGKSSIRTALLHFRLGRAEVEHAP